MMRKSREKRTFNLKKNRSEAAPPGKSFEEKPVDWEIDEDVTSDDSSGQYDDGDDENPSNIIGDLESYEQTRKR